MFRRRATDIELFFRQRSIDEIVLNIGFLFLVVSFPFAGRLNSIAVIVCLAAWLFALWKNRKFEGSNIAFRYGMICFVFILLHVFSILYSSNTKAAFFEIEKKLSILFFPLIILFKTRLSRENVRFIVVSFVVVCVAYLAIHLIRLYFHNPLERQFFVESHGFNLRRAFDMYYQIHPTYFSLYLLFCSTALLLCAWKDLKTNAAIISSIALAVILDGFIIALGSRMVIIAMFLTLGAFGFLYVREKKRIKELIFVLLLLSSTMYVGYKLTPSLQDRFKEVLRTEVKGPYSKEEMNSTNIRIAIMHCSEQMLGNINPIIGCGIGDLQDLFNSCYRNAGWTEDLQDYNLHNQYLETFYGLGLVGLISLLGVFFYPMFVALKTRNVLLLLFSSQFAIVSITESTLCVQRGIVYYFFFICILLAEEKKHLETA